MRVQPKVALDTLVPCGIVGGTPVNPLLIAHRGAPLQERLGVRPDRVPQPEQDELKAIVESTRESIVVAQLV